MSKRLLITLALALVATTGCNLVYKQNVQQGNAIVQEDLDKLRLGMSMNQVSFLLGTPAIQDPFHHDRWDYLSAFSRRGGETVSRKVTLYFENGVLTEMIGVEADEFIFEEEPAAGDEAVSESAGDGATAAAVTDITPLGTPTAEVTDLDSPATAGDRRGWAIQLGAFNEPEAAEREAARLRSAGFAAEVLEEPSTDGGQQFLVRQTGIATQDAASALLDEIRERFGLNGHLIPPAD